MKKLILILMLVIVYFNTQCQQIFQDGSGKANIFLAKSSNGYITFNSSDKSGSIGYNQIRRDGSLYKKIRANMIYGGDLKIGIKNGLGALLNDGSFKPSITLNGNVGLYTRDLFRLAPVAAAPLKGTIIFGSIYLRPSFAYSQYSYIDTLVGGIPKMNKVNKKESGVLLNINVQINNSKTDAAGLVRNNYIFIGLQSGFARTNNYNDLDEVSINTTVISAGNVSTTKSETGKFGQYKKYDVIPLNFDIGVTPRMFKHNYFGFNGYFRSNFLKPKNDCKAGIGIYLADEKHPSSITGGFAWQFNDIFNALQKNDKTTFEKSSIFFYVGYSIR